MILEILLKFFAIPLVIAAVMYVLVHFQLLFLHKFLRVDLSHKLRTKICILTFISSVIAVILLVLLQEYFKLHLNTGGA